MLLAAEHVVLERRGRSVFGRASVTLAAGRALLIEGANGAGKTTLLKILAGLLRPHEGRVERGATVFVGHQNALKLELSAVENLRFYAALQGGGGECAALANMDVADLADRAVGEMSAGQKRRVALARLFLCRAPLWLLDEPYANLDVSGAALLDRHFAAHLTGGGGLVIASHGRAPQGLPALDTLRLPVVTQAA